MKKTIYILSFIWISISLSSCTWEKREDTLNQDAPVLLEDLIQSYDLWYVDIDHTTGTGDVSFMSRAFTMSFMSNGEVFANNNMVGLGTTGYGYGINTGTYNVYNRQGIISIHDDVFGTADFEVRQLSINEISLFNRAQNVTYTLVGYQKYNFDFDRLFYENVTYFLQEYNAWSRTNDNIIDFSAPFTAENHLSFYVSRNTNVFESSESFANVPLSSIIWDYSGDYEVRNTSMEDIKDLILYYDINNENERFQLVIINDQTIELTNLQNGNQHVFTGRGYIQFKTKSKRLPQKRIAITNKHYLLK